MADIEIVADSGDLKAAIDLLNEYGMSFTQMVNKVQTEGNRLTRASKATTDQLTKAWNNAEAALDNKALKAQAAEEARILALKEQERKQYVAFLDAQSKRETAIIKQAAQEQANAQKQAAAEEAQAQSMREQQRRQYVDFLAQQAKREKDTADKAVADARELAREKANLTAKYAPLLAAEQTYLKMQNDIHRSTQLGILDARQQAAALDQLDKEYDALSNGVYLAGSRFNQFGEMAGIAGKSAGRFGMYSQQAGYQLGDFAVQIQGGTNAGVAFSQQFAQLAGLIPGLTGAITTFAAIGIGLLIQNLTRGKKEAENTYMQLSKFDELEDIFKSVGSSFETSMSQSISRIRVQYGDLIADFAKMSLKLEMDTLKANLGTVMDKATPTNPEANKGFLGRVATGMFSMNPGGAAVLEESTKAAEAYNAMLVQVEAAQARLFDGSINSKDELVSTYAEMLEEMKQIPGITQEILDNFVKVGGESGIVSSAVKDVGESLTTVKNRATEAFELYLSTNEELRRSNELAAVRIKYGEQSVQYLNAEKEQSLEILRTDLERSGMAEILVNRIIEQADAQIEFEQAAQRSALIVDQLLIDLSAMSGIDISGIFTRAQGAANSLLGTVRSIYANMAAVAAETKVRERAAVSKGNPLDPLGTFVGGQASAMATQVAAGGVVRSPVMPDWEDPEKAKKGGGGKKGGKPKLSDEEKDAEKAKDKLKEFFQQYNLNIKQQERLLGVQGQNREELEKVIEIENRLGVARTMVSETQIQAMAREELALERKLERQEEIYNMGHDAVENLLMDIVTGTATIEEAFKGMLANIIKEVYQSYVAKGAADMAGNALVSLFSANGNAFGAGGVKMFAAGGVVDSPTMFGYGGGKTGMMGEAGPEAIMPLKRNAQGKLGVQVSGGGGGNVNVTQVFQMSANGDASVKAIIQDSMPKIQEAAKMAVMSAQRRSQKGFK